MPNRSPLIALAATFALAAASPGHAALPLPAVNAPPPQPAPGPLTPQQLDELAAPIALYPDPLLAAILAASTYPLDVVEADRFASDPGNADLTGDALTRALAEKSWDDSVKTLVPFPQILQLMDNHLDWTEHLGQAFQARPGDVMDAVQRLRQRAQADGTLRLTTEQSPVNNGGDITIQPTTPDEYYVPSYDPWCAYGAWPNAPQPPFYFSPYANDCTSNAGYVGFDDGLLLGWNYVPWGEPDWRRHRLWRNGPHGNGTGFRGGPHLGFDRATAGGGEIWHHDAFRRPLPPFRGTQAGWTAQARGYFHGGAAADFPNLTRAPAFAVPQGTPRAGGFAPRGAPVMRAAPAGRAAPAARGAVAVSIRR